MPSQPPTSNSNCRPTAERQQRNQGDTRLFCRSQLAVGGREHVGAERIADQGDVADVPGRGEMFDDARQIRGDRLGRLARPEIAQRIDSDGRHAGLRRALVPVRCRCRASRRRPTTRSPWCRDGPPQEAPSAADLPMHRWPAQPTCVTACSTAAVNALVSPSAAAMRSIGKALRDQIRDMRLPRRICIRRFDDGDRCGKLRLPAGRRSSPARPRPEREERRCRAPAEAANPPSDRRRRHVRSLHSATAP